MATTIEYALLAGVSYINTRHPINQIPVPQGWTLTEHKLGNSGFEAIYATNGSEIVISFAGTNPNGTLGVVDWDNAANIGLATGEGSVQLLQAAKYYLDVQRQNPGATITLTGHSLGGGLAALVGVFFHVPATTFDQAPFANSAQSNSLLSNPLNILTPDVAAGLKTDLLNAGYTDAELAPFSNFLLIRPISGAIPNSNLINTIRVDGEFTSALGVGAFDPIGNPAQVITHGPHFSPSIDLHDQALLTDFLMSDATTQTNAAGQKQSLSEVTKTLTDLLGMMFDKNLFAHDTDPNTKDEDFLNRLVRHEAGNAPLPDGSMVAADAMDTRYTADLWKLAQDGGLTKNDSATYYNQNNISKALIGFAMQKYYEETKDSIGYKQELFTDLAKANEGSNGIRFDMTDVATRLMTEYNSNDKGMKLDAKDGKGQYTLKGYQYFLDYLSTTSHLGQTEQDIIKSMLPQLRDWYIQAGAGGMTATDTLNRGAFMLGGNGQDTLTGGTKADLLVGNAGDDILKGGDGSDVLMGGSGVDTYAWNASANSGIDTILDSDKQGYLRDDTNGPIVLTGGSQLGDNRVFSGTDANGANHIYTFVTGDRNSGGDLIVDGAMLIKDYNPSAGNHMGITLDGPVALANLSKLTGNGSDNYIVNDVRNKNADPQKHATKYAEVDPSISGSGPVLEGGGGNDIIVGQVRMRQHIRQAANDAGSVTQLERRVAA